jgi:hypothetical protein
MWKTDPVCLSAVFKQLQNNGAQHKAWQLEPTLSRPSTHTHHPPLLPSTSLASSCLGFRTRKNHKECPGPTQSMAHLNAALNWMYGPGSMAYTCNHSY